MHTNRDRDEMTEIETKKQQWPGWEGETPKWV
jgi:hypothetical protein